MSATPGETETRNILLIGMRGVGKSTVANALADLLQWTLVDTDALIERQAGLSVRDIFTQHGEAAFRAMESRIVAEVCAKSRQVISLGGGAVLSPANRDTIRRAGAVIWLTAAPDVLIERMRRDIKRGLVRPSLTNRDWADEVRELTNARAPFYAEIAQIRIDTDNLTPAHIARAALEQLGLQEPPTA